jgi:hypothetical protein
MKFILSLIILCTTFSLCHAQQATYIAADAKVWNFGNVGVFGDLTNNGLLGSSPSSVFMFLGNQWTNGYNASLFDEGSTGLNGTGGVFLFAGKNGQQTIAGGFNIAANMGASFPNFDVNNPNGVILADLNDFKIRNNLNLTNGHIYLNGWNLVLGQDNPGTITNYSDQRFIVTGSGVVGGFVYRMNVSAASSQVVFPIGTSDTSYSPAGVVFEGNNVSFHARVFDSVYQYATSGKMIYDSVVYKTWNIGQDGAGQVTALILQHNNENEAPEYVVNRNQSYISMYDYQKSGWETRSGVNDNMTSGTLSTGTMTTQATQHSRGFTNGVGTNSYFTKLTPYSLSYLPADVVLFNAYRRSAIFADLTWTTTRETDMDHFEIERMYDNEEDYTTIATAPTKAINGNSTTRLDYYYEDLNSYEGWTYYRLKVVSKTGKYLYTDVRAVPPLVEVIVYPVPNFGDFKVRIRGIKTAVIMELYDIWGQKVRQKEITESGEVPITDLPAGTYVLQLKHKDTQALAYTCKVIVIAH